MLTLKIVLLKIVMRISLRFNTLRYCISNKIHKNMRYVLSNTIKNGFVLKALYKDCAIVANSDIVCRVKFIYPWIFNEVFGFNIYKFYKPLEVSRQYSVIDIGANVGYAALYFAQQSWCKQVLSFELFPQNIRAMQENLALNSPSIQQKVILYPYGLGKKENIKSGGGK